MTAMSDSIDPCSLSRTCPVLVVAWLAPIVWDNPPDPLAILAKSRLSALPSPEFWFRFDTLASSIPLSSVSGRVLSRSIVGFGGWDVGGDIASKTPKRKIFRLWSFVFRLFVLTFRGQRSQNVGCQSLISADDLRFDGFEVKIHFSITYSIVSCLLLSHFAGAPEPLRSVQAPARE